MDFQIINDLYKFSKEFGSEQKKSCGLNDTECRICSYVYANKECSQEEVASGLKIDKTTIAKAISGLEKKGYLARIQSETDKRKKVLSITEYGYEKSYEILHLHDKWLNRVMQALTPSEREIFEDCCRRLLEEAKKCDFNEKT